MSSSGSATTTRGHPDARALDALATELAGLRTAENTPYRLVPLPLPVPIQAHGRALPAGYANFLVINGAVLVPAYGDPADAVARERLAAWAPTQRALHEAYPDDREAAAFDALAQRLGVQHVGSGNGHDPAEAVGLILSLALDVGNSNEFASPGREGTFQGDREVYGITRVADQLA